jgi:hypothetical protein
LRNVVTLFHYIEKERAWRKENARPEGFETLSARKPIGMSLIQRIIEGEEYALIGLTVAVGAEEPLAEHMMVADFFRKSIPS